MIQAICWVLVHSLWQGLLLALAGGGVILCTKRSAPAVRYRLLCGLFGLFLAGIGMTLYYEWAMVSDGGGSGGGIGISVGWVGEFCSAHAVQIVIVWLVFVVLKSIRMAVGWGYMQRMRREGLPAATVWGERVELLSQRLGIRRTVKLVESGLIKVPMVIGQLRPIILVPLGMINHLPAGEMEAVLLHELAHIRRFDHVVNMIQQAAECLLFFNPGFLWISALLREERENCCDDVAISQTGDRVEFVRALVRFKEHSMRGMGLAFPGNKRQLLYRVLRISKQENKTLNLWERSFLLGGCLVLLWLVLARANGAAAARQDEAKQRPALVMDRVNPVMPAVRRVSPELAKVLQTRQQVAQNMEWVEAQLEQLHRKPGIKEQRGKRGTEGGGVQGAGRDEVQAAGDRKQAFADDEREAVNQEQVERSAIKAAMDREKAAVDREKAERDRQKAELDGKQGEMNRQQGEMNRQQDEMNKQQVAKTREQAERDREQALRDRVQADRDRTQAERDKAQADRDRRQAELDHLQAERDRAQAELGRLQAMKDRVQADKDRAQAMKERAQADQERSLSEQKRASHLHTDR